MFGNVKEPEELVANGAGKRLVPSRRATPRSSARRFAGQPERGVREPPPEVRIVGEQLEELGVVLHHPQHRPLRRLVGLDAGRSPRRSSAARFSNLASFRHRDRDVLRGRPDDPVAVPPFDSAEQVVELLDDRRQPVGLDLAPASALARRDRKFRKTERSSQPRLLEGRIEDRNA